MSKKKKNTPQPQEPVKTTETESPEVLAEESEVVADAPAVDGAETAYDAELSGDPYGDIPDEEPPSIVEYYGDGAADIKFSIPKGARRVRVYSNGTIIIDN